MLGVTSEEVIDWMISMINSMFPTAAPISQMLKACGIECYKYLDRPRREIYIGEASSLEDNHPYKVRWCPGITTILQRTLVGLPPIEELIIPETVTWIGPGAFSEVNVSSISFPGSLKSIPLFACSSCHKLEQVEIPDSVEKIEYGAFDFCYNLTEITIPGSVRTIEKNAFKGCDALSEEIKEHIRSIGGLEALGEPKVTETDILKGGPEEHEQKEEETENKDK